jgi:hypothetical protein
MEDQQYPGNGHIVVNGEPHILAYQNLRVAGVRPGVDGNYKVMRVEHRWSRQGYTTSIEVIPVRSGTEGNTEGPGNTDSNDSWSVFAEEAAQVPQGQTPQQPAATTPSSGGDIGNPLGDQGGTGGATNGTGTGGTTVQPGAETGQDTVTGTDTGSGNGGGNGSGNGSGG